MNGRIVLKEEVTEIVDQTKIILGIKLQNMSESVGEICKIAIELKKDLRFVIENLLDIIQIYYPDYKSSVVIKKILEIERDYFHRSDNSKT